MLNESMALAHSRQTSIPTVLATSSPAAAARRLQSLHNRSHGREAILVFISRSIFSSIEFGSAGAVMVNVDLHRFHNARSKDAFYGVQASAAVALDHVSAVGH